MELLISDRWHKPPHYNKNMTITKLLRVKSKEKTLDDEFKEHMENKYVGIANGADAASYLKVLN